MQRNPYLEAVTSSPYQEINGNPRFIIVFPTIRHLTSRWSSGQSFRLLIMRSRVRFPVLPWEFYLEVEDSHGDHGLGSLVELTFKAPPGTSSSYITIHLMGTT
jgi:hypothetical protein